MTNDIKCPFCNNKNVIFKREIISPYNNKTYKHYYCKNCELEFFYPLVFENVYEFELLNDYALFHTGQRRIPVWTKEVIKVLKKLNINLKNKKILDIGAGDGNNYLALREEFNIIPDQYYAIELDKKSINTLKKRGITNIINKFFNSSLLDQLKTKFDVIMATEVLEHQVNPRDFLDTAFKRLKDDGIMVITVPNRDRFFIRYKEVPGDIPPHHFLRFNKKFFLKNFLKNLIHLNDYSLNAHFVIQAKLISQKILGTESLWYFFIIGTIFIRFLNLIKGGGLIVILKNVKK
ncbi:MAG TPA: methyltransferase domain-containing protein [Candidatus Desulfofervidus auxilii]|uniref:Methyltransferase domain-containing protein n=1 Tax=Desulfofervidus auxilii TaxID=1621989 RepID=A0A7C1W039_DESA2|nr:methyltransferase domain-containing protein [Candidatus Desulfofervidus auxilii]